MPLELRRIHLSNAKQYKFFIASFFRGRRSNDRHTDYVIAYSKYLFSINRCALYYPDIWVGTVEIGVRALGASISKTCNKELASGYRFWSFGSFLNEKNRFGENRHISTTSTSQFMHTKVSKSVEWAHNKIDSTIKKVWTTGKKRNPQTQKRNSGCSSNLSWKTLTVKVTGKDIKINRSTTEKSRQLLFFDTVCETLQNMDKRPPEQDLTKKSSEKASAIGNGSTINNIKTKPIASNRAERRSFWEIISELSIRKSNLSKRARRKKQEGIFRTDFVAEVQPVVAVGKDMCPTSIQEAFQLITVSTQCEEPKSPDPDADWVIVHYEQMESTLLLKPARYIQRCLLPTFHRRDVRPILDNKTPDLLPALVDCQYLLDLKRTRISEKAPNMTKQWCVNGQLLPRDPVQNLAEIKRHTHKQSFQVSVVWLSFYFVLAHYSLGRLILLELGSTSCICLQSKFLPMGHKPNLGDTASESTYRNRYDAEDTALLQGGRVIYSSHANYYRRQPLTLPMHTRQAPHHHWACVLPTRRSLRRHPKWWNQSWTWTLSAYSGGIWPVLWRRRIYYSHEQDSRLMRKTCYSTAHMIHISFVFLRAIK